MEYRLIRSKNRRRSASLQIGDGGELIVRAPLRMPKFFLDQFVKKNTIWIEKRKSELAKPKIKPTRHFESVPELIGFIERQVAKYQKILGLYPTRLRYTTVRTYWGSCSPADVLSFNLHLQYVPKEAVEYIVVHELCHIRHRGHGQRFWNLVNKTYSRTPDMRKLLRSIPRTI